MSNPDGSLLGKLVWLVALVGIGYGAWWGYKRLFVGQQDAVLQAVLVNVDGNIAQIDLTFEKQPATGDPKDVQITLASKALTAPVVWDWAKIAAGDNSSQTTPDTPPPLNQPLRVRIPIQLKPAFHGDMSDAVLEAKLQWAGMAQDEGTATLWNKYENY